VTQQSTLSTFQRPGSDVYKVRIITILIFYYNTSQKKNSSLRNIITYWSFHNVFFVSLETMEISNDFNR